MSFRLVSPTLQVIVSITDPESVSGLDKAKVYRPLYNVQTLCDVGSDMVLVDAGYPTGEDLAFCEQQGITVYGPWQENSFTKDKQHCAILVMAYQYTTRSREF